MHSPSHRLRTPALAALALATTLALGGCSALSNEAGGGSDGDKVSVAAGFYPLQYVAERVGGDRVDVDPVSSPNADPHNAELTVRETASLTAADLVVLLGGFQPAVDDATEQNAGGEVLDAASAVDLLPVEGDHEHEHDGHDHGGDEHGEDDPHFWQDPLRMAALGDAVADSLSEIDPDHADEYADNAAQLRADLEELDEEFRTGLATCERDTVVVSHDAFGYLEDRYGLHFDPVAGLSPDAEPTPSDLQDLQELIREEGVTTVFSERLASRQFTAPLAADLGLETAVLDPLEGLSDETADEDYLSLMRANLAALQEANACR
ncbi:metal ABC transporter substrate-binding protein [Nocardioides ochotonae]|uniref:metal ABC transporter substrate-binding protein n=1 Tax=Nocardioides ochotonae TaxID=2685869 RepID=UPI00140CB324|nr:zinc ABC transporter substrate-binding protein [Nocardioides ochotonae]